MSRDQSYHEDYGATWRVRYCKVALSADPDTPVPVSSLCDDDVTLDVVTSQPEPEVAVSASGLGRRRFRDAALAVASHFYEMGKSALPFDSQEEQDQVGSQLIEAGESRSDDVTEPFLTSTKSLLTSSPHSGRGSLLEEMLRARAKAEKVASGIIRTTRVEKVFLNLTFKSVC